MRYHVAMGLHVSGAPVEDLLDSVSAVMESMADIDEMNDALLDWSIGMDGETGICELEFTVLAGDEPEALTQARLWARTAIHAAGAGTPGWDGADSRDATVCYAIDAESGSHVRPLVDA